MPENSTHKFTNAVNNVQPIRNSSHMAKILSVCNRLQAGDYENCNGGKRRVSRLTQFILTTLQFHWGNPSARLGRGNPARSGIYIHTCMHACIYIYLYMHASEWVSGDGDGCRRLWQCLPWEDTVKDSSLISVQATTQTYLVREIATGSLTLDQVMHTRALGTTGSHHSLSHNPATNQLQQAATRHRLLGPTDVMWRTTCMHMHRHRPHTCRHTCRCRLKRQTCTDHTDTHVQTQTHTHRYTHTHTHTHADT